MRRLILALALGLGAVAIWLPGGATADGPLTLKRAIKQVGPVHSDGNRYVSHLVLFTKRGPVGTARYTCIETKQFRPRCSILSKFSEGRIRARGRLSPTATIRIVGGSGAFRDARGEIEFSQSGRHAALIYRLTSYG